MENKLIVGLDVPTWDRAVELVEQLTPYVGAFKVGMELYNAVGPSILQHIQDRGAKVFLDLKFHDIPNTVAGAARSVTTHGVWMFNVHTFGGVEMMRRAAESARETADKLGQPIPKVIGVTVLTSIDQRILNEEVGVSGRVEDIVVHLAERARGAGLDGVVCSPLEIEAVRRSCGADFILVTPGIRTIGSDMGDQRRVMTPPEAVAAGSSYLVVVRPIIGAADPVAAAKAVVESIRGL